MSISGRKDEHHQHLQAGTMSISRRADGRQQAGGWTSAGRRMDLSGQADGHHEHQQADGHHEHQQAAS